jgi:hypothetical protein
MRENSTPKRIEKNNDESYRIRVTILNISFYKILTW